MKIRMSAIGHICVVLYGFYWQVCAACPQSADNAKNGLEATNAAVSSPKKVSDYTKTTGFVADAHLPTEQPSVLWKASTENAERDGGVAANGLTDAVIADGILYFGDEAGHIVAVDIKTQAQLWKHAHGSRIAVSPSVDKEFVYFGSSSGITALRRDSGEEAWYFLIDHGAGEATPIPSGEHVFASGYDGHAYCLKKSKGGMVWEHDFIEDGPEIHGEFEGAKARFQDILARPNGSACNEKLFIQCVFDQSRVIALDRVTGKRRWTFQAGGWISPAPTIVDDRVFVASQDKHLYCLDVATGNIIWKFQTPSWLASRVAARGGDVFLPHHGGRLYQLRAESGELIRIMEPPDESDRAGLVYSFPIISNQTAYFATGKGLLLAFDIESGDLRWKLRPSLGSELFTNPATDGSRIFVTSRPAGDSGESAVFAIGSE